MDIIPIPAGEDNYMYLIAVDGVAAAVDPVDADRVWAEADRRQLSLKYILVTHHHYDHIMGVPTLARQSGARVLAGETARIQGVDQVVAAGDKIELGEALITVLATPGHGDRDVSYLVTAPDHPGALFCGDTLFVSGCGRILEGTAEQLWNSLQMLKHLPDQTQVYCGHEYTEENLRFACHLFPEDIEYRQRWAEVKDLRAGGKPSIPSTIGKEKKVNPFLRVADLSEFKRIRRQKDLF